MVGSFMAHNPLFAGIAFLPYYPSCFPGLDAYLSTDREYLVALLVTKEEIRAIRTTGYVRFLQVYTYHLTCAMFPQAVSHALAASILNTASANFTVIPSPFFPYAPFSDPYRPYSVFPPVVDPS